MRLHFFNTENLFENVTFALIEQCLITRNSKIRPQVSFVVLWLAQPDFQKVIPCVFGHMQVYTPPKRRFDMLPTPKDTMARSE